MRIEVSHRFLPVYDREVSHRLLLVYDRRCCWQGCSMSLMLNRKFNRLISFLAAHDPERARDNL